MNIKQLCRLLLIIIPLNLWGNNSDFSFRHLTLEDGLSNSHINCIAQDQNGFIWIGTENGLNKYDGYTFTHYYANPADSLSLLSDEIFALFVDKNNTLWIGTFRGLSKYNADQDSFTNISLHPSDINQSRKPILDIKQGKQNTIWLATSGNGLINYNISDNTYRTFTHDIKNPNSLSTRYLLSLFIDKNNDLFIGTDQEGFDVINHKTKVTKNYKINSSSNVKASNSILCFYEYNKDSILIGTRDGLFCFNRVTERIGRFLSPQQKNTFKPGTSIHSIIKDRKNRIWISAKGEGIFCINNNKTHHIYHDDYNTNGLLGDNTRELFEDRQGSIWIVSYQAGINILPNKIKIFTNYELNDPNGTFDGDAVSAITCDHENNIWLGTDGGGLKFINRESNKTYFYYPTGSTASQHHVSDKVIMSLAYTKNKDLWIGTYQGGVSVLKHDSKTFKNYTNTEQDNSLSHNYVSALIQDKRGDIWVGTNGGGLNKYQHKTDDFTCYAASDTINGTNLVNDWINALMEDNNNRIWIGTFWGLSVFDPYSNHFINYVRNDGDHKGISNNVIYALLESSENEIWIGTRNGLNKFLPQSNSFKVYNTSNGLPGNVIYGIQEDNKGNLWVSTNRGLCNLNPKTEQVHNYFESDGLASSEFFRGASYKSAKGELFFGSIEGLNSFFPDSVHEQYAIPNPVLTSFKIFEKEIRPGHEFDKRVLLSQPIYNTNSIKLKHRDNSFSIDISALDFVLPEKNMYQYKMEGFDEQWKTIPSNRRHITYTNLDAGSYQFKYRSSSIDNRWSENYNTLNIEITPPIYRTWVAFIIYYFLLVGLLFVIYYISIKRVKLSTQIKLERLNREKSDELNQAKLRFFTNISHEFRTPITLIIGPMEKMLKDKNINKSHSKTVNMMLKNANRLLRLVNQLMDLRKIESGSMTLKVRENNLTEFIKDIHFSFSEMAARNKIDFKVEIQSQDMIGWFDEEKLDKILFNLLSNAFKYTPINGSINISIARSIKNNIEYAKIDVKDSGKGIPSEEQDKVFERFYQSKANAINTMGSGVGLSLTKNLVQIHKGDISFESEVGTGTLFTVSIPISEDSYNTTDKANSDQAQQEKYIVNEPILSDNSNETESLEDHENQKSKSILVVEDNYDLRKYIANELPPYYNVYEAENGKIGLDIAINKLPDLIISDVAMPEMDGLELCKTIKTNLLTNHIPVILLTAKTSIEQRIEGIEQGADSYIPKPFHPDHLHIRAKKLIELRSTLKSKYSEQLNSTTEDAISVEDKFIEKITTIIKDNITETELSIEWLSSEMGMSRGHLHRKIKFLTEKSPSEFVRIIKLNESLTLLRNKNHNISEVSYMVGFNSPSYFANCFKSHFKLSPTEFIERNMDK